MNPLRFLIKAAEDLQRQDLAEVFKKAEDDQKKEMSCGCRACREGEKI